jgi:hypothetical protein
MEFIIKIGAAIDPDQMARIASEIEYLVGGIDDGDGSGIWVTEVDWSDA